VARTTGTTGAPEYPPRRRSAAASVPPHHGDNHAVSSDPRRSHCHREGRSYTREPPDPPAPIRRQCLDTGPARASNSWLTIRNAHKSNIGTVIRRGGRPSRTGFPKFEQAISLHIHVICHALLVFAIAHLTRCEPFHLKLGARLRRLTAPCRASARGVRPPSRSRHATCVSHGPLRRLHEQQGEGALLGDAPVAIAARATP